MVINSAWERITENVKKFQPKKVCAALSYAGIKYFSLLMFNFTRSKEREYSMSAKQEKNEKKKISLSSKYKSG